MSTHTSQPPVFRWFLMAAVALSCVACGGGGGGAAIGPSTPVTRATAEGLWSGTLGINSSTRDRGIAGVVLDNGDYWFLYSIPGNGAVVAGMAQGNATSTAGNFTSESGKDFNFDSTPGLASFTASGTFASQSRLGGTLVYSPSSNATFETAYSTVYDQTPNLADLAGSYSGNGAAATQSPSSQPPSPFSTTFTISAVGAISGNIAFNGGSCPFSGSAAPHAKGNVFDTSLTFFGTPCPSGTISGVAFFDADNKVIRVGLATGNPALGMVIVANK